MIEHNNGIIAGTYQNSEGTMLIVDIPRVRIQGDSFTVLQRATVLTREGRSFARARYFEFPLPSGEASFALVIRATGMKLVK